MTMITHEDILEQWKIDSNINPLKIQDELVRSPLLHAKYLEYYMNAKSKMIIAEKKYNMMKNLKRKYFSGKMDKDELQSLEWPQYQGLKLSNSEFHSVCEEDHDLIRLQERLDYTKLLMSGLEYILKQIDQRNWTLKTIFEHQKFMSGS